MKVCLQHTVGTVHCAVSANMKNLIAAADIGFCAGTFLEKGSFVSCEEEHTLSRAYGILHRGEILIDTCCIRHDSGWDPRKGFLNRGNGGMVTDRFVNVDSREHKKKQVPKMSKVR